MSIFSQNIKLKSSNPDNVIEKITIKDVKKSNICLFVPLGYKLYIPSLAGGMSYVGASTPIKLNRNDFVSSKHEDCDVYLYHQNEERGFIVSFYGGKYTVNLSIAKGVKGTFSLAGTAYLTINNPEVLINYYKQTMTLKDIEDDIAEKQLNAKFTDIITTITNKRLGVDANENDLAASVIDIVEDMIDDNGQASYIFRKMGFRISKKDTSMHVNAMDDAKSYADMINKKILDSNLYDLDGNRRRDDENKIDKERQFEIDRIKAGRSTVTETITNINKTISMNGKGAEKYDNDDKSKLQGSKAKYCIHCGAKINNEKAKFCSSCGERLDD